MSSDQPEEKPVTSTKQKHHDYIHENLARLPSVTLSSQPHILYVVIKRGVIARKLQELEMYNAKSKARGLAGDKPLEPFRGLSADKVQELTEHLRDFNNREEAKRREFCL